MLIVAGEPGGSIPATRERIERSWGARVIDHHGLTEVGPVSFECWEAPGLAAHQRGGVHCRSARPADRSARCSDGQTGRTGHHQPRPDGQPRHPLPHRRHRRPALGAVPVRTHVGPARGRHPGAGRRHGQHSRRQRVSGRHRVGRAPACRRSSSSARSCRGRARCDRCASRSKWLRSSRTVMRWPRAWRISCERRSA